MIFWAVSSAGAAGAEDAPAASLPVWHSSLRSRLYAWAYGLCRRHEDALDVVQEAMTRLVARGSSFESTGQALAWMRRTIASVAIDRWRARGRERAARTQLNHVSPAAGELDVNESARTRERVLAALAGLSDAQRMVVLLKVYDGRTFADTAAELGIAEGTAKSHFVRALQALREELNGLEESGELP